MGELAALPRPDASNGMMSSASPDQKSNATQQVEGRDLAGSKPGEAANLPAHAVARKVIAPLSKRPAAVRKAAPAKAPSVPPKQATEKGGTSQQKDAAQQAGSSQKSAGAKK